MIPLRIELAIRLVANWVKNLTDDWAIVKWEILNELDNEHRFLFNRRDQKTKELLELNDMEKNIIIYWQKLTGIELIRRDLKDRRDIIWWQPKKKKSNKL